MSLTCGGSHLTSSHRWNGTPTENCVLLQVKVLILQSVFSSSYSLPTGWKQRVGRALRMATPQERRDLETLQGGELLQR
ncbi:hypothetical protein I79_024540 [Cricetulus griseus]|uniref:Uncharacterized protein n=1 Tax=Cricetulus griseus TaxID=10029 RepID=G3IKY5_CRIGR|nr:hypothetical protein I79_024540 [Cricetulus griseus]